MSRTKQDVTPEDVLAWADGLTGVATKESARKQGCSAQTIINRRKKMKAFIAQKFDIEDYRMPLYGLYPLAINSLTHNLKKNDTTCTIALLKGLQILVDKSQNDNVVKFTDIRDAELDQLIDGFRQPAVEVDPGAESPGSTGGNGKTPPTKGRTTPVLYADKPTEQRPS